MINQEIQKRNTFFKYIERGEEKKERLTPYLRHFLAWLISLWHGRVAWEGRRPRSGHINWGGAATREAEPESGAGRKSSPTGRT